MNFTWIIISIICKKKFHIAKHPISAPYLKICHRNDSNLNGCIKQSIDLLRPYLKTGIPALQIPSCEPLRVPQIEISQSAGPVSIRSTYTDIEVQGGTSFILKRVKYVSRTMVQIQWQVKIHLYFKNLLNNMFPRLKLKYFS